MTGDTDQDTPLARLWARTTQRRWYTLQAPRWLAVTYLLMLGGLLAALVAGCCGTSIVRVDGMAPPAPWCKDIQVPKAWH